MKEFKFFGKNEQKNSIPTTTTLPVREYSDLERLWCQSIFNEYSYRSADLAHNTKRIIRIFNNDTINFMITNEIQIISPIDFEYVKRVRILFQVNGINIYDLMITTDDNRSRLIDFNIRLATVNGITEWEHNERV
jgi:hypothetical protein